MDPSYEILKVGPEAMNFIIRCGEKVVVHFPPKQILQEADDDYLVGGLKYFLFSSLPGGNHPI